MKLIVIFGATGDLACKKTFPSLFSLFKNDQIDPSNTRIVGFGRTDTTVEKLIDKFSPHVKITHNEKKLFDQFKTILSYFHGSYDDKLCMNALNDFLLSFSDKPDFVQIFYLVLPPSSYTTVLNSVKKFLCTTDIQNQNTRVIVEKPFGTDLASSDQLSNHITSLFDESQIYRIDHYLGKENVQNIMALRFANRIFTSLWNKDNIDCVLLNFKEDIGTMGRGQYYDGAGVVRDIIQNHTMQVLALLAMEPPTLPDGKYNADAIKDEKVRLIKCIRKIDPRDVVYGQYVGDKTLDSSNTKFYGYKEDSSIVNRETTTTPTFVSLVLHIDNERWQGVPFILRAGKALNERKAEIRIQFKESPYKNMFLRDTEDQVPPNELVIRLQPKEAIYLKFQTKIPDINSFKVVTTELDLNLSEKFDSKKFFDAYEKLLLDVINARHTNFVRSDELRASWELFTPLLSEKIALSEYTFGSRGPEEADELSRRNKFVYDMHYRY